MKFQVPDHVRNLRNKQKYEKYISNHDKNSMMHKRSHSNLHPDLRSTDLKNQNARASKDFKGSKKLQSPEAAQNQSKKMLNVSSRTKIAVTDQNLKVSIVNFEKVEQQFSKMSSHSHLIDKWETGSHSPRMEFNP